MKSTGAELPPAWVRVYRRGRSPAESTVISRGAMHVHTFGVLSSIESGHPGFVSDDYLNAITAETTVAVLELCVVGLWERAAHGYRVADDDTLCVASQIHRQLLDLAARCVAAGGHLSDADCPHLCAKCGSDIRSRTPAITHTATCEQVRLDKTSSEPC